MADPTVQDLIRQESQSAGVPPELALAVAEHESNFNPTARNPTSGATGTFQFLPSTATARGINAEDPVQNIKGGVGYLRELMDRHQGDLNKVLSEYGGVKTDTAYVPGVLARMGKFRAAAEPPPTLSLLNLPRDVGPVAMDVGRNILKGLDPRTEQGRSNLLTGVAAGAASFGVNKLALPLWGARLAGVVAPIASAYGAGALEKGGEQLATGGLPSLSSMHEAGKGQAETEVFGKALGFFGKSFLRRVGGQQVAKSISKGLGEAVDAAGSSVKAAETRLDTRPPAISPSGAGQLVEQVAQGPSKSVREQLGEAVGAAAKTGPRVDPSAINQKLTDVALQLNPGATAELTPTLTFKGQPLPPDIVQRMIERNPELASKGGEGGMVLPPDHPLPGVLNRARNIIKENTSPDDGTVPFETVHQVKLMLDSAINYKSPVRTQLAGTTQGLRKAVRGSLEGHAPYEEANAAYGPVAKLFTEGEYPKLHKEILSNPEGLVNRLNWKNPTSARMIKELTVDLPNQGAEWTPVTRTTGKGLPFASDKPNTWAVPGHLSTEESGKLRDLYTKGGDIQQGYVPSKGIDFTQSMSDENGHPIVTISQASAAKFRKSPVVTKEVAAQGEAAWSAVRATYTHEKLVSKGPQKMLDEMRKMEASSNGQEFIQTMYGDPAGQAYWKNLKQIGEAWEGAVEREKGALAKQTEFGQTKLARYDPTNQIRDVALAAAGGHFSKYGAIARLRHGPDVNEMVQWAADSNAKANWLVKHVLSGPEPAAALADFMRYYRGNPKDETTQPSTAAAATPPPTPR